MVRLPLRPFLAALVCCAGSLSARVSISESPQGFRIEIDGEWLGDYRTRGSTKPILYPLNGPGGVALTRTVPPPSSDSDHLHHESLWYAHGDINGHDLWRQIPGTGRVEVTDVLGVSSGETEGTIRTRQRLLAADGKVLGTDERELRVDSRHDCRVLDYTITWIASHGQLHLGATKEGAMGIRVSDSLRADKAGGRVVNAAGETNGNVIRHRAPWVDFNGQIAGETFGIALLDHPSNPLHPPWWLAREYGLLSANPFGGHELGGIPETESEIRIPAGERLTFRYRIVLHRGDEKSAHIARLFAEYAATPPGAAAPTPRKPAAATK